MNEPNDHEAAWLQAGIYSVLGALLGIFLFSFLNDPQTSALLTMSLGAGSGGVVGLVFFWNQRLQQVIRKQVEHQSQQHKMLTASGKHTHKAWGEIAGQGITLSFTQGHGEDQPDLTIVVNNPAEVYSKGLKGIQLGHQMYKYLFHLEGWSAYKHTLPYKEHIRNHPTYAKKQAHQKRKELASFHTTFVWHPAMGLAMLDPEVYDAVCFMLYQKAKIKIHQDSLAIEYTSSDATKMAQMIEATFALTQGLLKMIVQTNRRLLALLKAPSASTETRLHLLGQLLTQKAHGDELHQLAKWLQTAKDLSPTFHEQALDLIVEHKGVSELTQPLLKAAFQHPLESIRVTGALHLQTPEALALLQELLADEALPPGVRARVLTSLASSPHKEAFLASYKKALVDLAPRVRAAGFLFWLMILQEARQERTYEARLEPVLPPLYKGLQGALTTAPVRLLDDLQHTLTPMLEGAEKDPPERWLTEPLGPPEQVLLKALPYAPTELQIELAPFLGQEGSEVSQRALAEMLQAAKDEPLQEKLLHTMMRDGQPLLLPTLHEWSSQQPRTIKRLAKEAIERIRNRVDHSKQGGLSAITLDQEGQLSTTES